MEGTFENALIICRTILGIAGNDFALMASDTRLCEERAYMIYSRNSPHQHRM